MTKIIAEVGLNHMGSSKKLNKIIKDLILSKVDGITVQIQDNEYYNNSKPFRKHNVSHVRCFGPQIKDSRALVANF